MGFSLWAVCRVALHFRKLGFSGSNHTTMNEGIHGKPFLTIMQNELVRLGNCYCFLMVGSTYVINSMLLTEFR